jgi:hypothetical protein
MPRTERRFQEQQRSKEDVKTRANMRGGDFDSYIKSEFKFYKVREGKNVIRILPPTWEGAKHYGYDTWVVYQVGVDKQSYLSLSKMKKQPDPIEEAREEAARDGDEKLAKELTPKHRVGVWLIDREAPDEGPQFWAMPFTVDKDFSNLSIDEDTGEVLFIDNSKTGCDVRFYREKTSKPFPEYTSSKMKLLKPSPLHEDPDQAQDWLEYVAAHPVPEILQYYSYDHISAVINGASKPARDPDDEDEAPAPRPRPKLGVIARAAEADDGDDEPAPKRPTRTKIVEPGPYDDDADAETTPPSSTKARIRERLQAGRAAKPAPVDEDDDDGD